MTEEELFAYGEDFLKYLQSMPQDELASQLKARVKRADATWAGFPIEKLIFTSECLTYEDFPWEYENLSPVDTHDESGSAA